MRLRIRELMTEKGEREGRILNQKIVAGESGVDASVLSRYMKGFSTSFHTETLEKLQDYFNVSWDELFERKKEAE